MEDDDRPPCPEATTDHTMWVWDAEGWQWVEQEKPPPPPLVQTPRPDDTSTNTWERIVEVLDGVPTVVWVPRPWTPDELAAFAAQAEKEAARAEVRLIIDALQAEKARADVVIAKTNAQITGGDTKDVARAVKRVADAVISLVRYVG